MDPEIQHAFDRNAVQRWVLAIADSCEAVDPFDDDPTVPPSVAFSTLADLLGNVSGRAAAEGIQLALRDLHTRWTLDGAIQGGHLAKNYWLSRYFGEDRKRQGSC